MPLVHAIAHHIRHSADGDSALKLRDAELPVEGYSERLLDKLKHAFLGRLSREHGSFTQEDDGGPLASGLRGLLKGEQALTAISRDFMTRLQKLVEENKVELDAHCLFFVEKSLDHHTFTLFVARQSEALTVDGELAVSPSYAIDTGPTLFGIKVDLTEWQERENYAYLSLLPPRGNPALIEAFTQLTGFNNGIDKAVATMAFLEGVDAVAKELPEEKAKDYRAQVVEYCMAQEAQDEPVRLRELAQAVEGIKPDEFVNIVARHRPEGMAEEEPMEEVIMDRRSLRQYVKFAGRERDLAISFSSFQLNERVKYDPQSDTLHITGLPSALKKQLLKYLQEN